MPLDVFGQMLSLEEFQSVSQANIAFLDVIICFAVRFAKTTRRNNELSTVFCFLAKVINSLQVSPHVNLYEHNCINLNNCCLSNISCPKVHILRYQPKKRASIKNPPQSKKSLSRSSVSLKDPLIKV